MPTASAVPAPNRRRAVEQADREARTDREQRRLADELHVQPCGDGGDRDEQSGIRGHRSGLLVGHHLGRVCGHERRGAEGVGKDLRCRVDQPERDRRGDDGGHDAGDEDLHGGPYPAAHHEEDDQQRWEHRADQAGRPRQDLDEPARHATAELLEVVAEPGKRLSRHDRESHDRGHSGGREDEPGDVHRPAGASR